MIQKIVKNSDIKFCVDEDSKIQDKFIIKFYTIDKSKGITRTADDVITVNNKRYIKLNWSTIKLLDNGMLNYEVNNLDSDADYDDGVYNSTFTRTTYYYLCTDGDGLADAVEEIELRVDQITTDITGLKSNNANITTQMGDLQNRMSSVETKSTNNEENITGLQNRMSVVETKSTNNENSINTMSTDYAALVSRLEKLEANGSNGGDSLDDRVLALEKIKKSLDGRIEEADRIVNHFHVDYLGSNITYEMLFDDLYDLEAKVTALEPSTQGSNESISSMATEPSALATEPSSLATEPSSLATEPSSLATEPSSLATEPSALATDNDSLVNRVSALENRFQDFDSRMLKVDKYSKIYVSRFPEWSSYTQISNTLGALRYRVSALERGTQGSNESISSMATEPSALETEPSALATEPSALATEPSALATNNDNIVNRASALKNRASALATDNDSLVNRVSALENSTNNLDNHIYDLWADVNNFYSNWASDEFNSWVEISNYLTSLNKRITALETR